PFGCRMSRYIAMQNPSRSQLQDDQNVKELESCGDRHQEITGDDGIGVIAHKRCPVLGRDSIPVVIVGLPGPVLPHRARRYKNAKLERELVATRAWPHVGFSRAIRTINSRTVCGTGGLPGFPAPKELKAFPMPSWLESRV